MKMVALRVSGYRRFEEESTLDLTPRVVALVGPNEAGKSSLLDAMENITDPAPVREFRAAEFTNREQPDGEDTILSALFELEAADQKALADIPGASQIRLLRRWRTADGQAYSQTIPLIPRPHGVLRSVQDGLSRMLASKSKAIENHLETRVTAREMDSEGEEIDVEQSLRTLAGSIATEISAPHNTLTGLTRQRLEILSRSLSQSPAMPKYIQALGAACIRLSEEHGEDHPNDRARKALGKRVPTVRVLRDNNRELKSSYPFEEYEEAPAPLENLLSLAGIEWQEVKDAAAEAGNPLLANLLRRANRQLEQRLHGSWKQATVSVELREQGGALNLFPYDAASDTHSEIEDRSDGFRAFLSMLAFTTRHSTGPRKLILAIDEAERHLHYNAQADLVEVLTKRQEFAAQTIYTTHSAGCLPEDLGSAIRVVKPVGGDRSEIKNGFWSAQVAERQTGGFTSLLMAMGADAVAFTPTRNAIITEGPSDALLLPALLRAALNRSIDSPLGLQVAGGLAWTPPRRLSKLESEAAHVVYLTDSDKEGHKYKEHLETAGVDSGRIFALPKARGKGLSIEDCVEKVTLVSAVNFLLKKLRPTAEKEISKQHIPDAGAARAIEKWQEKRKIEPISKTAIAEQVLRLSQSNLAYVYWDPGDEPRMPLLRENRRLALVRLHGRLRDALDVEEGEH
jgi:predicted ATP-dependent endonuclease of OLD family